MGAVLSALMTSLTSALVEAGVVSSRRKRALMDGVDPEPKRKLPCASTLTTSGVASLVRFKFPWRTVRA